MHAPRRMARLLFARRGGAHGVWRWCWCCVARRARRVWLWLWLCRARRPSRFGLLLMLLCRETARAGVAALLFASRRRAARVRAVGVGVARTSDERGRDRACVSFGFLRNPSDDAAGPRPRAASAVHGPREATTSEPLLARADAVSLSRSGRRRRGHRSIPSSSPGDSVWYHTKQTTVVSDRVVVALSFSWRRRVVVGRTRPAARRRRRSVARSVGRRRTII